MTEKTYYLRPCRFTAAWGYNTQVDVINGEKGQPKKLVSLVFGESGYCFREEGWSNLTIEQARDLAWELNDAADQAEREMQA